MRKLKTYVISGFGAEELVEEFNERMEEFGITNESDVVSVNFSPPTSSTKVIHGLEGLVDPDIEATFVFWSDS